MSKKAAQKIRRTGKRKTKETFKKYGCFTNKHIRLKQKENENRLKTKNTNDKKGIVYDKKMKDWGKKNCGNFHKVDKELMKKIRHGNQKKPKYK
jgi:hypothetical protein